MNSDFSIPMIHVSAVATMTDLLDELGVPLSASLADAHLPTCILEERDGYVPFRAACNLAHREGRRQGIDNVGLRAMLREGSQAIPAALRDMVISAPTLYQGIGRWADLIHRESSHAACWVDDTGPDVRLRFSSTFAQDVPGQADWIWFATMLHLTVVRLFVGPDWRPPEIAIPYVGAGLDSAREFFPDTRFVADPEVTGLTIPRELLSTRPLVTAAAPLNAELPEPPDSFEDCLTELVRHFLPDGPPRIDEAASMAGMSVRTLQRRLASRSLSYEQLVSNVRYEHGRILLQQEGMTVGEIARALGYGNPTHFARAFRRIAGMSPREYRKRSRN